ncbi:glycosyltransferase [Pseudomonas sp.]|uniref:glycosyltransferase n=1 Tax=Pseudomonas sp. TaxID=306 RepID=UPI002BF5CF9A|nr:glycosyltransferase [Pseudomonas sp.]HUE91243.1 glycosyltransferase [Pseudomonas sp.]
MPAFKAAYLREALDSLQAQTYRPLELVICDDCLTDQVQQLVDSYRAIIDFPIRYERNMPRLRESKNLAKCVGLTRGEYLKFLYDDDVLHPECIARMADVLCNSPQVALVSSRRRRIDGLGCRLPDSFATAPLFDEDVLIDGTALVSFLGEHTINFIGEPSTVMCRRDAVAAFGEQVMALNGLPIQWVGDLALYAKLLRQGHLAFLAQPLSDFRVSTEQFSQVGRDRLGIGDKGHENFRRMLRELGWSQTLQKGPLLVAVSPLVQLQDWKAVDLLACLVEGATTLRSTQVSYDWLQARKASRVQQQLIEQRLGVCAGGPSIVVLVLDRAGDTQGIKRTLTTLFRRSSYSNIQSYVISTSDLLLVAERNGAGFVLVTQGVSEAINRIVGLVEAQWLLLVEAGDEFTVSGLQNIALELAAAPECRAVYADAMLRDAHGGLGPALRPDFNLDLLLSYPVSMSRHWIYRRDALLAAGGFDPQFEQALEFELQLRLIELGGLAGLGHVSEPLLITKAVPLRDNPDELRAIERHLLARGYEQAQVASQWPGRYQLDYGTQGDVGVSILIVAAGPLVRLQRCVESLLAHTVYPSYEILLLQPEAAEAPVRQWLDAIEQMAEATLRVIRPGGNRAQCCNRARESARSELLVFLSPATAAISDDWLAQMVNHGVRPEVGVVGAKLLSPEGRIEHAGLILGLQGPAGVAFKGEAMDALGYMNRLQVEQNYSAVSGDCMMIRKDLFAELGGFDEAALGGRWSDLDLCLKVREAGLLTVWSPRVQLMIDGEVRVSAPAEDDLLYDRWLPQLASDPAYNDAFSTQRPFQLAELPLTWRPLNSWRPLPTVLALPADRLGCGHYRVIQPFKAQQGKALLDGTLSFSFMSPVDLQRYDPDVVIMQRQYMPEQLAAMQRIQRFSRAFKVYELDDFLPAIPLHSAHREHMPRDVRKSMRLALRMVDRFVVSTPALADACSGLHERIHVVENRLPVLWWKSLQGQRRQSARPRVGWAGGIGHHGDLLLIADVVKELASQVDWVFFGMCPEKLRPYISEFHPGVEIEAYPAALAALNLDLALAPLEQNLFNECKSNLRLLEYGACGFPVICSDVGSYRCELPVTRVRNRTRDWLAAIREHLHDRDASEAMGDALQAHVRAHWMLEGAALQQWSRAWLPD